MIPEPVRDVEETPDKSAHFKPASIKHTLTGLLEAKYELSFPVLLTIVAGLIKDVDSSEREALFDLVMSLKGEEGKIFNPGFDYAKNAEENYKLVRLLALIDEKHAKIIGVAFALRAISSSILDRVRSIGDLDNIKSQSEVEADVEAIMSYSIMTYPELKKLFALLGMNVPI